jgi:hypothetical protein
MKHPVSADPGYGVARHKGCTFTQALYDEAKKDGWTVISMKNRKRSMMSALGQLLTSQRPIEFVRLVP